MKLFSEMLKPAKSLYSKATHFARNSRGVAAVEFALIAPILLILFIGSAEVSLLISVDRKLSRTSSAIADLVAQESDYTTATKQAELKAIFGVTERIMYPYSDRIPCVVITVVRIEAENDTNGDGVKNNDDQVTAKVTGSVDNKNPSKDYKSPPAGQCNKSSANLAPNENARQARQKNSLFPVPDAIKIHDTDLVVAEVEYDHKPIIGFINSKSTATVEFDSASVTIGDRIFLRPRQGKVNF
jgi:Flp pilus assembly protein TadG